MTSPTLSLLFPSSPLLWCQQHLFLLYVILPCFLCGSGSTLWVWCRLLCGRMSVCCRLCHEWGNLCAIHTVWLQLPKQILPCKKSIGTLWLATLWTIVWLCLILFLFSFLSIHSAAERDICDWGLLSVLWMHQHWCCVPTQGLPG